MQRSALVLDDMRMPGRLTPQQHQPARAQLPRLLRHCSNGDEQQITLADQATPNGTITITHLNPPSAVCLNQTASPLPPCR
jgi:hypothetical protein